MVGIQTQRLRLFYVDQSYSAELNLSTKVVFRGHTEYVSTDETKADENVDALNTEMGAVTLSN